jgi:ABC-type Fe3+ transport system permease subunit
VRFGLLSAGFVVFTITITDFGNAVVIGGDFTVLATEIYSQVSGQMKFGMGAVVGILLLLPAAAAIWIERAAARRQKMIGTASAQPYVPTPQRGRDILFWLLNMLISLAIVATITTVVMASLIRLWPYRLDLTLKHYNIDLAGATRRCGPLLGSRHWRPLSARCCCSCSPSAFAASRANRRLRYTAQRAAGGRPRAGTGAGLRLYL